MITKEECMSFKLQSAVILVCVSLCAQSQEAESASAKQPDSKWSVVLGLNNYHTRLETSEAAVDGQVNDLFGKLFLRWDKPETFKDWSDDWMLWDIYAGADRELNGKWSFLMALGGGAGTVKNEATYRQYLIPLKFEADFSRSELFFETGFGWYPFGKPWDYRVPQDGAAKAPLKERIRPVLELVAGYGYHTAKADVRLGIPRVGNLLHIPQDDDYHVGYLNPRVGLELSLDRANSIGIKGGYVFFHDMREEFDSSLVSVFYRRRF